MTVSSAPAPGYMAATANNGASWDWMRPAAEMAAPAEVRGYPPHARVATRALGLERVSVRRARDFTCATLRHWGLTALADDVVIAVSELMTNALRHTGQGGGGETATPIGRWPIRLGLLCSRGCVLCAVADPSPQVPVIREPDYLAETGRGLHVVASLSDGWGWTVPSQDGKVVWARFLPQGRDEQEPAEHVLDGAVRPLRHGANGAAVRGLRA